MANGAYIDLDTAATYTSNYQSNNSGSYAFLFDADIVQGILGQTGTAGIRCYMGITDSSSNQLNIVLVGVDSNGNDQVGGLIADLSSPCPPNCSESNPLNVNGE